MNNQRRKELRAALEEADNARSVIETCRDEEQECLDNIPENLQGSERYMVAEATMLLLDEAVDSLEVAVTMVEEALSA